MIDPKDDIEDLEANRISHVQGLLVEAHAMISAMHDFAYMQGRQEFVVAAAPAANKIAEAMNLLTAFEDANRRKQH
jgi:hypothetical protein